MFVAHSTGVAERGGRWRTPVRTDVYRSIAFRCVLIRVRRISSSGWPPREEMRRGCVVCFAAAASTGSPGCIDRRAGSPRVGWRVQGRSTEMRPNRSGAGHHHVHSAVDAFSKGALLLLRHEQANGSSST
ncbi:MAG: hypothetical protein JWM72_4372 [Actinomycetia bacterium]|nr:hypothetical protein [Actinomycetes bacterium]